ncbi:hypothetical protein L1049_026432 [Liquidambar formosana]|uniref:Uncharacterized protein n=1 Tax=Liquidambar formosana TaxID=63359 RepID=A0AAP0NEY6_LIQFO
MGPPKKSGSRVILEDSDFAYDMRLERRWRRRSVANNNFKPKSYSRTVKKTIDDVEKREGMVDKDYAFFLSDFGEYKGGKSSEEDDTDPQYAMFLKHFREDGKSYVLDIIIDDDISILMKYEEEDGLDDELKRKTSQTRKNVPSGEKKGTPNDLRSVRRNEKMETPGNLRNASSNERKSLVVEKKKKSEVRNLVSCRTNRPSSQKPGPKVPCSPNPESKHGTGYDTVDQSYEVFLKCLKLDGDVLVLTTEDGKQCKYEEDDESSSESDSEIAVTDSAPQCDQGKYTPFVTSKVFVSSCIGSPDRSSCSQFREKLMDILSMPYDQKEYEELMREASLKKPVERHRELRGGIKSYSMRETKGLSYLEHYTGKLDIMH